MSNWKNKEKVLKAIYMEDYIPDVMEKIDPSLLADRDVIQYAICIDGCSLEYASDELKNDKEIVVLAVQQDGSALCYASDNLKDDKEVVMAAVKNYGYALSDASDSLKADKEVCLAAIGNSGEDVLDDISDSLKKDKEIISAIDNFEDDFDFDDSEEEREKPPGWVEPIHKYRIDPCFKAIGGEFVCGKVSEKFVNYWAPIVTESGPDKLTDHMKAIEGFDTFLDPNSPKVVDDEWGNPPYRELENIEHFTLINSDQSFLVTEITDEDDKFGVGKNEQRDIIGNCLFSREGACISTEEPKVTERISEEDLKDFVPVLLYLNINGGDFGSWFVGTDENGFDASKLAYSQVETELGIFIERVWYDKEELKLDDTYLGDSTPKGETSSIGWLYMKYRDSVEKYTDQYIDENELWANVNE
jgi:hypothetical protein